MIDIGSVCSGYGGLDLGIGLAIPGTRLAWVADYEPPTEKQPNPKQGPSIILAHHWPDVPNLGDITAVRWPDTRPVKIVAGGTPCQDVSVAGARGGMRAGTRSGIWSSMVDAIAHHRPTLVIWENVRGALSAEANSNVEPCPICLGDERECSLRALGRVLGDLAELGYDAVWVVLPASAVGAPHRRERVFVAAWPADPDSDPVRVEPVAEPGGIGPAVAGRAAVDADRFGPAWGGRARFRGPGSEDSDPGHAADPDEQGWQGEQPEAGRDLPDGCADADSEGDGWDEGGAEPAGVVGGSDAAISSVRSAADADPINWGQFGPAIARWESVLGRTAPRPTELSARGSEALSPAFVEWMMGLPAGHVTGVPGLTRNDQLKALGNGVVPQQAAAAVTYLLRFAPERIRRDLQIGD